MISNLINNLGANKKQVYKVSNKIITVTFFNDFFIVCDINNDLFVEIKCKYLDKMLLIESYIYK